MKQQQKQKQQEASEFYSKFLTPVQSKHQPKARLSSPKENNIKPMARLESQPENQMREVNDNFIQYNSNNQNALQTGSSDLSEITYGLFVNQTKERLFKTFFKNQQENVANQTQKRQQSPKMNHLKAQRKEEAKQKNKNRKEDKVHTEQKKKEYYEDIIKANRDCIRINPFLNKDDENGRKFEIEYLNTDRVVEIEIGNEVQIRREQTEQKHKEILLAKIPDIFEKIQVSEQEKYFIKNKYKEALDNYDEK